MTLEPDTIECLVHTIKMGDVEDPDLYVEQPIWEWQQTEEGQWIMRNSSPSPMWKRTFDQPSYGHLYKIHAYLKPIDYTYWSLKYK
jgi:hypothetical protein